MNRLLERQLKRSGVEYSALPESVRRFVDEVGRSYDHHDADRALTERSIELSSQELVEANRRLAKEAKNQAALLENLRSAIAALSSGDDPVLLPAGFNAADPVALSDFLIQQFTRKHEAEETVRIYEMAVRSTSDGIVISDATRPDNPIIFCNQAFLQTTGYPAEEVIGRNCRFLQAEDKDQPGLQVIREAITNRLGCHVRIRNYRRSGEMFWNDFRLSPVFDAQQQLRFYVGVQTDVTADVMEQELGTTLLAQRQELLHVAEEILAARTETEIVHTVVHRLGNLLPYDTASIYMTDAAAGVLRPIALLGPRWTSPDLDAWTIPEGTGIIGSIIRSGKGELINNAHRDPRSRYPDGAAIATEHLVVHPLRTGEYVWGAFAVNRMSDRQFTDEEFEVLQFLASYASLALRNIRLMGDLREHEEAQRTVLQTISDGVISIDRNGIVRYANVFAETMFGYRYGELIGKHFQILLPPMTGRTPRERLRAMLGGILYPSPWHALEMTGIRSDGERLSLEVSIGETKRNGQRLYTGIIRNITERKREEELLRATMSRLTSLIQTIQAGVLVEDETRHISLINQNFCDLFGIPVPSAQLLGTDCSMAAEQTKDLFADPEGFIRRIDGMLAERRVVVNDELALKDGRTFERDYIPIFSADQYKGHMWLYRDVTERKTAEQEATNAKRIAEESLRAKQDFLAKMSHELRTPMNSVIGLTNLMLNTQLGEDQTTLMQGIKTAGSNLLVIINDILDLAKIEAGKLTIDRSEIVLREMIDNIVVGLRPMARQKGLELNVTVDPSLPAALLGDKVRLSQIIINLLSNAIKFTHEGSVTIACTAGIGPDARRRLICTVSDTGIGIPLHKQENIFEAFAQASQDIAVRYGGTGLGLTIVRQLVSLMHGEIRVESTEGKGSSFIVTLPLEESLRHRAAGTAHRSIPQELKPLKGTVLLVEDNPANQLVAARSMSLWSVDTDVAPDGMTALSMLVQKQYDLVLMDIQMPGIDGFETTRRIREEMPEPFRSVPIVAMTASVLYDPEARASAAGMNGYVSKPFELEDLHAVLVRFLPVRTAPDDGPEAASVRSETGLRYLDTTFLEGIAGNNRSFVREMLTLFARNTPQYLESIRTALEARDFPAVKYTAHTLKPTGAYIGINELKALAAALEVSAESGDADGSAAENFAWLESLCLDVLKDVEEWIRQEDRKGGAA